MINSPKKKKDVYAGLSITHHEIELAVFSPKSMTVEQSYSIPLPYGLIDNELDTVRDANQLKELLAALLKQANPRPATLHISLPATLLRMVEMPKMDNSALYVSLSSEAERYKTFDNTEASVDFVVVNNPGLQPNMQQLVLGAVRSDVLGMYLKMFKELKLQPASITLEPVNILRGMAATGVLDSLVQQIGTEALWGMILVESGRTRFSLWRGAEIVEMREMVMDTSEFEHADAHSMVVEDLLEEMRRTTKNTTPALWLTSNMPVQMELVLSQRLGIPVRTAPTGNALGMSQPLKLATLGVTTSSLVPFPFDLDIMEGSKSTGITPASAGGDSAKVDLGGDSETSDKFIPLGMTALIIGGLVTGILYAVAFISGQGLPDLQSKVDASKSEISMLQAREATLRSRANLNQELQNILKQSKARTHAYVALTDELRDKIPTDQVWIQTMSINNKDGSSPIELTGKALNHQSVINFARSFDDVPYTKAVLIDNIKEGKLSQNLVYDFKISGSLNLEPILSKLNAEASSSNTKTDGSTEPNASSAKSGA